MTVTTFARRTEWRIVRFSYLVGCTLCLMLTDGNAWCCSFCGTNLHPVISSTATSQLLAGKTRPNHEMQQPNRRCQICSLGWVVRAELDRIRLMRTTGIFKTMQRICICYSTWLLLIDIIHFKCSVTLWMVIDRRKFSFIRVRPNISSTLCASASRSCTPMIFA